jgi:hypothetical protein
MVSIVHIIHYTEDVMNFGCYDHSCISVGYVRSWMCVSSAAACKLSYLDEVYNARCNRCANSNVKQS